MKKPVVTLVAGGGVDGVARWPRERKGTNPRGRREPVPSAHRALPVTESRVSRIDRSASRNAGWPLRSDSTRMVSK